MNRDQVVKDARALLEGIGMTEAEFMADIANTRARNARSERARRRAPAIFAAVTGLIAAFYLLTTKGRGAEWFGCWIASNVVFTWGWMIGMGDDFKSRGK